jgi:neutral ceramidase
MERAFSRGAKKSDVDAVDQFVAFLNKTVVEVIGASLEEPFPAKLEFGQARAGFAMNRRQPDGKGGFSNNPNPAGPVDHDVPVLKVSSADGKMKAVLFGYACHNTTLSGSKLSGDYAGFAQKYIEETYAGATALFMMGCGGDQNPYPRRGMVPGRAVEQLVQDHGRALANAVSTAINAPLRAIHAPLRGALEWVSLDYAPLSKEALTSYRGSEYTPPVIERAQKLMRELERGERPSALPCPVQVLHFGNDLTLVAIGGEPVVDYSLRLKRELHDAGAVWVAGYANDVFGYLGSRRVIQEGGYEGGGANTRILNHPGPFTLDAEEKVIAKVHELRRGLQR